MLISDPLSSCCYLESAYVSQEEAKREFQQEFAINVHFLVLIDLQWMS